MTRFVSTNELHEIHSSTYEAAQELKALGSKILASGVMLEEASKFGCEKLDIPSHLLLLSTLGAVSDTLRDAFIPFFTGEISEEALDELRDAFDGTTDAAFGIFEQLCDSTLADVVQQRQPGTGSGGYRKPGNDGGSTFRAPNNEEQEIVEAIIRGIFGPDVQIVRDDSIGGYIAGPRTGTDD